MEDIAQAHRYDDTRACRAEQAQVVGSLKCLTLEAVGVISNELSVQEVNVAQRSMLSPQKSAWLRGNLVQYFDGEEFRTLCHDLGVDYDDLKGEGKTAKARDLIVYLDHLGRISELIEKCIELRPQVDWRKATYVTPPGKLPPIFKSTRHPSNISPASVVSTSATKGALSIQLRSQMIPDLGFDDGIRRVKKKGFFNAERNKQGKGIFHQYERLERQGENLVIDHTTGLTWQQSGSPNLMFYSDAKRYIDTLNGQRFAGYSDWRFPTLDEAMSLMEPDEKNGDLYIDSVFDETQTRIWTADQSSSGGVWKVDFFGGICEIMDPGPHGYVRAVR